MRNLLYTGTRMRQSRHRSQRKKGQSSWLSPSVGGAPDAHPMFAQEYNELDWEGISDTRFNSFIHSFLDFRASERRRQERESYELPKLSVAERNRTSACAGRVHMYICTHSSTECPGVAELPQQLDHITRRPAQMQTPKTHRSERVFKSPSR